MDRIAREIWFRTLRTLKAEWGFPLVVTEVEWGLLGGNLLVAVRLVTVTPTGDLDEETQLPLVEVQLTRLGKRVIAHPHSSVLGDDGELPSVPDGY